MYCPTCGAGLAKALSYCNHCGADLSTLKVDGKAETVETTTDTLVWVIVGTTITLLGMALGTLVLVKDGNVDRGLGVAVVILSFVALGLVEGVLVWRLVHLNRGAKATRALAQQKDLNTEELGPATAARALREPSEPVASVTEQTTRALEPAYREGKRG
jgi:hypothetical protein